MAVNHRMKLDFASEIQIKMPQKSCYFDLMQSLEISFEREILNDFISNFR